MDTILIVCGAGASSTFLASRIRSLAKKRGLELDARAISTPEIETRLVSAQVLLVGPHLETQFAGIEALASAQGVPTVLLPSNVFGQDGAGHALDLALARVTTPAPNAPNEGTTNG